VCLTLAVAFAIWAVARSVVTAKTLPSRHVVVQTVQAQPVQPRESPSPIAVASPLPSPTSTPVPSPASEPNRLFERSATEPSEGPAINQRAAETPPPDPMDFHHDPSEAHEIPPEEE
jgi:hypothetical protein